jgi:hypothetical protein
MWRASLSDVPSRYPSKDKGGELPLSTEKLPTNDGNNSWRPHAYWLGEGFFGMH